MEKKKTELAKDIFYKSISRVYISIGESHGQFSVFKFEKHHWAGKKLPQPFALKNISIFLNSLKNYKRQ